jgi:cyclohexyl-isocyanide hydratase
LVGILAYDGVDLLDVAVPYELFKWAREHGGTSGRSRAVDVVMIGWRRRTLTTRDGLTFSAGCTNASCPRLDALWVPGGDPPVLKSLMADRHFLEFLRRQGAEARYVTSVCEGALLLAQSGLLDGYKATTHWAFLPCLQRFPKVRVVTGYPRYVVDRNRVTGGGISSGLDEALMLIGLICGRRVAKKVQLSIQYNPNPPFRHGDPCQAGLGPATECPMPDA